MELSMAPTILELMNACAEGENSPDGCVSFVCTAVSGDELVLYLQPQEMGCLPDKRSEIEISSDTLSAQRYVLAKIAKEVCGEPKYWLVVCSQTRSGWIVLYGDFESEDEGDFEILSTRTMRVVYAPV